MQEASSLPHQRVNLPFRDGHDLLLLSLYFIASPRLLVIMQNPKLTLFAFVALFVFALPLLFTLRKFVEDDGSGERSHQLTAKFRS